MAGKEEWLQAERGGKEQSAVPPGPRGLREVPMSDLQALRASPLGAMVLAARRYGDFVRYPLGTLPVYLAIHPNYVRHVLQDNSRNYSKDTFQYNLLRTVTGDGLLTSDGSLWLAQRRMEQPAFHRQRIATFGPLMTEACGEMLAQWEPKVKAGQPLDIAAEMMEVALKIVGKALFSLDIRSEAGSLAQDVLVVLDHIVHRARMLSLIPDSLPTPGNRRFQAALARLDQFVYAIIAERRRQMRMGERPCDDFLSLLMAARDEEPASASADAGGPGNSSTARTNGDREERPASADSVAKSGMSDRQLHDEVITLIIAGHETVASALTWTWYLLSMHPAVFRELRCELDRVLAGRAPGINELPDLPYTRMVFEEALRLYPPAWIISRKTLAEDQIGPYRVPAGALVVTSPYVTHRLPEFWPNPEGFDPERFAAGADAGRPRFAYFPFGGGPRLCIGNNFALVEAQLVLATVAQRYRLDLTPGQAIEPEPSVTLRPKHGLWMTAHA
jgi:cytochrome P450